jgi:plasmid stabilization system protein ParE
MDIEIHWTHFAENELYEIFNYYKVKAGWSIAKKLVNEIYYETLKLKEQPELGQVEELLKDRNVLFRYLLIRKNFKVIYRIDATRQRIEINDIFDVRQNPTKISRGK